jgi:hypothetical protein
MSHKFDLRGAAAPILVALLALVPVSGEAADITSEIPFSFAVRDVTLPPGTYHLSTRTPPGMILVEGLGQIVISMAIARGSFKDDLEPKLVFHRYGDEYFLRQVWNGDGGGYDLPETRSERAVKEGRSGRAAVQAERIVIPAL